MKRARRPLRAPVLARAGGEPPRRSPGRGGGRGAQNLGPGRPGRPRWSCSFQQVRRAPHSLSVAEPPPPPLEQVRGRDPSHRPLLLSSLRAASSALLPSPGSSALPALPGQAEGATGSNSLQHHLGDSSPRPAASLSLGSVLAQADRARRGRLLLWFRSGFSTAVAGDSPPPPRVLRSPRQHRSGGQLAGRHLPGEPRTKTGGWLGPPAFLGSGWLPPWGSFDFPRAAPEASRGEGLVIFARFLAWVCSSPRPGGAMAGPSWKSKRGWEGRRHRKVPGYSWAGWA